VVVPVVVELSEAVNVVETDVDDTVVLDVSDAVFVVMVEVCVSVTPSPKRSLPY
jgi:hypothetical protein